MNNRRLDSSNIPSPKHRRRRLLAGSIAAVALTTLLAVAAHGAMTLGLFADSRSCLACHNGMTTAGGRDISFGNSWRPGMMANAARDPYWQATVRRETMDHPTATAAIEEECSRCHMPMSSTEERASGKMGVVMAHLAAGAAGGPLTQQAMDGVSCSACHRISAEGFGDKSSFTGHYKIEKAKAGAAHAVFGPYDIEPGQRRIMRSATTFEPRKGEHMQSAELCATCHTLFTHALGPDGKVQGTLAEQVPYLEWKHSDYNGAQSCQDCHMPTLDSPAPIASVLSKPRQEVSEHLFRGGNFMIPRMLGLLRNDLGVAALPQELDAMVKRTTEHLRQEAAMLALSATRLAGGVLEADVVVTNKAGHKLPTAYPSRRAWLHLRVTDGSGSVIFESGELLADGSIKGNDNDADAAKFEPHYAVVDAPDKVQIYEPILVDHQGAVTTGLLQAVKYIKDNRILPEGFDKASAGSDIAVKGAALQDADFKAAEDTVRYRVPVGGAKGPFKVDAELLYQPIGHRWAHNLGATNAAEPRRFMGAYKALASSSAVKLASVSGQATAPAPAPPSETTASEQ